jgi:uncharacterized protein YbjQ (UPF0145 family)
LFQELPWSRKGNFRTPTIQRPYSFCTAIQQFLISIKQKIMIDQTLVTTNIELSGYRVTKNLGVVRGITVRSRSILGNIAGGLQTLFGGTISIYVELCEKTREEAFQQMLQHADQRGANAIISVRYDANEVISGVNEVLAYGTAVVVERI